MTLALEIRTAQPADLPALLALYRHLSSSEPASPGPEAERILQEFERYPGSAIYIGLLGDALAAAWDRGCYKVMLMTGSKKPETLAFYEAVGFQQTKTGFQIRRAPPG
jgi:hypothetical protein